ncbi:isochorismatase family protein [Pedobacter panaciterrae]
MADYLKGRGVTEVAVCGVAADFCVYYTANDALDLGFKSSIITRAAKPIDRERYERVKKDFQLKGELLFDHPNDHACRLLTEQ